MSDIYIQVNDMFKYSNVYNVLQSNYEYGITFVFIGVKAGEKTTIVPCKCF